MNKRPHNTGANTLLPSSVRLSAGAAPRRRANTLQLVVAVEVVVAAEVAAAAGRAAALLVDLGDDGRARVLHLLELLVEVLLLGVLVVVEPLVDLLERLLDGLLVVVADLVRDALLRVAERVLHRVDVVLERVTRLDLVAHLLVLLLELLRPPGRYFQPKFQHQTARHHLRLASSPCSPSLRPPGTRTLLPNGFHPNRTSRR